MSSKFVNISSMLRHWMRSHVLIDAYRPVNITIKFSSLYDRDAAYRALHAELEPLNFGPIADGTLTPFGKFTLMGIGFEFTVVPQCPCCKKPL